MMDLPTVDHEVETFDPKRLAKVLAPTGVELSVDQVEQLTRYGELLHARNTVTNLTAVRDIPGVERRLLLESVRLVPTLRSISPIDVAGRQTLLDVGTGGGLPGMVLAICCPDITTFLLDATGKKIAFLDDVVADLGLTNVHTIHGRAEETGHQPRYRNAFDLVTARAVSSLSALLELGLPMLRTGGTMLLPKGVEIDEELDAASRAASLLNGEIVSAESLPDVGSTIETRLVLVRKTGITPGKYPRRSGVPARDPLGTRPNGRQQQGSTP
jgi:16S rRNA (guanine527-N7)-methyltransferase